MSLGLSTPETTGGHGVGHDGEHDVGHNWGHGVGHDDEHGVGHMSSRLLKPETTVLTMSYED